MVNTVETENLEPSATVSAADGVPQFVFASPEDYQKKLDETFFAILEEALEPALFDTPFVPPQVEREGDIFTIKSKDEVEVIVCYTAKMLMEDPEKKVLANGLLDWASKKRSESFVLLQALLDNMEPYEHQDGTDIKGINEEWFSTLDKLISATKGYPEFQNEQRVMRLYQNFKMLSEELIRAKEGLKEEYYDIHRKELEELKTQTSLTAESKDLLEKAELLFHVETENVEKILENIDIYIAHIKGLNDSTQRDLFYRLIPIIITCDAHLQKREAIRNLLEAIAGGKEGVTGNIDTFYFACLAGDYEFAISIAEKIETEELTGFLLASSYMNALYKTKNFKKLFEVGFASYDNLSEIWKDNLSVCIKEFGFTVEDFNTVLKLKKRMEEDREYSILIHDNAKRIIPECFSDTNEAEKTIIGITIDLKFSDAEGVKICEINTLPSSGLEGYQAAYQQDLRDNLREFYEEETGFIPTEGQERFTGPCLGIRRSYITTLSEQFNGYTIKNNSTPSLHARAGNKDMTMLDAEDFDFSDVFPEGIVLSKAGYKKKLKKFISGLQSTDLVVLKPVNSSVGRGVIVLSKKDILKTCDRFFKKCEFISDDKDENVWSLDANPNFVIQKCAKSDPVHVRNNKEYDATMRYVVSMIVDHQTGDVTVHPHGAYWKLPPQALSAVTSPENLRKTIVSQPPSSLTEEEKNQPFSERVDPETFTKVGAHLERFLKSYAPVLAQSPEEFTDDLRETILSPTASEARKSVAIDIATNDEVGHLLEAYFRYHGEGNYKELIETIENFAVTAKKKSPAGDFARAVMRIPKDYNAGIFAEAMHFVGTFLPKQPVIVTDDLAKERKLQVTRNGYVLERQRRNSGLLFDRMRVSITNILDYSL